MPEQRFDFDSYADRLQKASEVESKRGLSDDDGLLYPAADSKPASGPIGPAAVDPITAKELEPAIKFVGSILCRAAGVSDLSKSEVSETAQGFVPLVNKYRKIINPDTVPWLVAVTAVGKVVSSRWDEYKANRPDDVQDSAADNWPADVGQELDNESDPLTRGSDDWGSATA